MEAGPLLDFYAPRIEVELGVVWLHFLKLPKDGVYHRQIPRPLVVGWNDVPRSMAGGATVDRIFISVLVIIPLRPVVEIRRVKLPLLIGIAKPRFQPLLLFVFRNVQH